MNTRAQGASVPLDLARDGPPAFVIVGKTGAGKTTLVDTLFGYKVGETGTRSDVTKHVTRYVLPKTGVSIYDTPGAGGIDDDAESAMREFLQLDVTPDQRRPISADLVIFLFSHLRIDRADLEFFAEVNAVYGPRLLAVKNYEASASETDNLQNIETIRARCGREAVSVDAKNGTGVGDLIREILRLLPPTRVLTFNNSLRTHRRRATEMTRALAIKYSAQAAVVRSEGAHGARSRLNILREEMRQKIALAYIDELEVSRGEDPISLTAEDHPEEALSRAGATAGLGALIGLLAGPLGALLGALLGGIIGAGTTPRRYRGGSEAVIDFLTYAVAQARILDLALHDPEVQLTRGAAQAKKWLQSHEAQFRGLVQMIRRDVETAVRREAIVEALDNPNTTDESVVELLLRPVADSVFLTRSAES